MPANRSPRRAARSRPKYVFSSDEDERDSPPKELPAHDPLPTPPSSASPSASPSASSSAARPARSSHTRNRPPNHIPRPPNAFIIFRSEFCERRRMSESGIESDHSQISIIAGHVWNNLDKDEKQVYKERAKREKEAHMAANPTYRYAPNKSTPAAKRKVQRDSTKGQERSRKLAEILISGLEGEEFNKAVKKLDEGNFEVALTDRTSKSTTKRHRHARRRQTRMPVVMRDDSVEAEVKVKEESPSPPLNGPFPFPPSSPSTTPPESVLSGRWVPTPASNIGAALQLAPYYNPIDGMPSVPFLSGNAEPERATYPHLRPGAASQLTLAQLCDTKPAPHDPDTLHMPRPLTLDTQTFCHNMSWRESAPSPPTLFAESAAPSPPSPSTPAEDLSLQPGEDTEAFLTHEVGELTLCYPDDASEDEIDFGEYLTGI